MSHQTQECLAKIEMVLLGEINAYKTNIEGCIETLKDGQADDVVPVLTRVLHYWRVPVSVHSATIRTLRQFGTDAAVEAICTIFTNREHHLKNGGFDQVAHDLLSKVATGEICAIGSLQAFQEFVGEIDRALQIEDYGLEWLQFDVREVLEQKLPIDSQHNLIRAILYQPLSSKARKMLLAYLRRDAQTSQLLEFRLRQQLG